MALQILLARVLGVDSFGRYVYVMTVSNFLVLLMPLGLGHTTLRYVPAYSGKMEWGLLRGFLRRSGQIVFVVAAIAGPLAAAGTWAYRDRMGAELADTFILLFLFLPAFTYLQLQFARLRAFKRPVLAQAQYQISRPLMLGLVLVFVVGVLNWSATAPIAMFATIIALVGTLIWATVCVSRMKKEWLRPVRPEYRTKEWVKVGLQIVLIVCFNTVLNYCDTLMIGSMIGTDHAGIYSAAVRSAQLISFGLAAVNLILAPMISELYSLNRMLELQRIVNLGALGVLIISLPAFIVLLVFGDWVLSLFGTEFAQGYAALVWLSLGQLVNAFCGFVGLLLVMTGNQQYVTYTVGASALLNVVLNAMLIPIYGITGGAIATSLTMVLWNTILTVTVYRRLGINPTVFTRANRFHSH